VIEGQLVTPTLRLVRALGQGGMGSVWVADHLALHTQVAVKFMYAKFAQNADFVRRFQTEAIAAAAIKSPHVAQVFDHGISDDYEPYIVMELLEGEDLRSRLKRTGPLTPAELAPIVTQVCKALARAHQIGIVHRDIKPDNVFLMNMGDELFVKVLDFGIAKLADDDTAGGFTMTGNTLGTPYYMSPEQLLSSRAVDFRSDLWSLGVVVYQALTGARPFRGETIGAVSVAVNAGSFPRPSMARPGLTPALDAWIQRALQREPSARYASAKEMAEAFEHAVANPLGSVAEVELDSIGVMEESPDVAARGAELTPRTSTGPTLAGTARSETPPKKGRMPLLIALVAASVVGIGVGGYALRAVSARSARAAAVRPAPVANDPPLPPTPAPLPSATQATATTAATVTSAEAPSGSASAAVDPSAKPAGSGINPNDLPSSAPPPPVGAVAGGPVGHVGQGAGTHGGGKPPVAPTAPPGPGKPPPPPPANGNADTIGF
jgi:serine/threonine-protein kinase